MSSKSATKKNLYYLAIGVIDLTGLAIVRTSYYTLVNQRKRCSAASSLKNSLKNFLCYFAPLLVVHRRYMVGSFVLFVEESLRGNVLRTYSTYPSNCIAIVRHILGGVYGGSLSASERSPPPLNSAGRSIVVVLGNKTTFRHCLKGKAIGFLIRQRRFVL
jgi:hypothetical protein